MGRTSFAAWLAVGLAVAPSTLGAATYTFTGDPYAAPAAPFTAGMRVTGSFATAAPLPPNLPLTPIGPGGSNLVLAWSFSDGVTTYTQANSALFGDDPNAFRVSTDAGGNVVEYQVALVSPLPPHTVGQPIDAFQIASQSGSPLTQVDFQRPCDALTPGNSCFSTSNDQVVEFIGGSWSSRIDVVSVPTLGMASLAALAVLLVAAALGLMRGRRRASRVA